MDALRSEIEISRGCHCVRDRRVDIRRDFILRHHGFRGHNHMTKTSARQEPEAPAVIREHHVQDRFVNKGDREQSGWTALSVFERTWRKGQLAEKELIEKGGTIAEEE